MYGLSGSVGVLRVHGRKYSHVIAFNLHALKFCNHARTPGQDQDTQTGAAIYAIDSQRISTRPGWSCISCEPKAV
nr:MAG TPA: hypothetical protein [Caudoviricetes sp.]